MVTRQKTAMVLAALLGAGVFSSSAALAEEIDESEDVELGTTDGPRVHHAPVSTATMHRELTVDASLDHPHLLRGVKLVYHVESEASHEVPFRRSTTGSYLAVIPSEHVVPSLGYSIELTTLDGVDRSAFASRDEPHPVQVSPARTDQVEQELDARLDGRRSVASAFGEYVSFGKTSPRCEPPSPSCESVDDQYWRTEVRYTYRPLRTVAEFSIRGGVVRGKSLSNQGTGQEVGLNYGAPSVRFRLSDSWHLETEALASITEVGFSVGGGTALLVGDPYGTKLVGGVEVIGLDRSTYFGSRFYTRVDVKAHDRVLLSPVVEVSDFPHADRFGVRLLAEAAIEVGAGFGFDVQGGYQARDAASGGPTLGGRVHQAF